MGQKAEEKQSTKQARWKKKRLRRRKLRNRGIVLHTGHTVESFRVCLHGNCNTLAIFHDLNSKIHLQGKLTMCM